MNVWTNSATQGRNTEQIQRSYLAGLDSKSGPLITEDSWVEETTSSVDDGSVEGTIPKKIQLTNLYSTSDKELYDEKLKVPTWNYLLLSQIHYAP